MKTEQALQDCIKEMFRRVGMRYPNKKFTSQDRWYMQIAWTHKQEQDFKDWMIKYLRKKLKYNIKTAIKEVGYFFLMYGWKLPSNDGCLTIIGKEKKL